MALDISNTIIDEEIRSPTNLATQTQPDEHDVTLAVYTASAFRTALEALSLDFVTSPMGFPQYAENSDFVEFTNPVTDFFLRRSATGTEFPADGTATNLKVGGTTIFLFATDNPDIVVGRVGIEAGATDTADADGEVAFVIGVEENVTAGAITSADMWIALYAPITHNGADLVDAADQLDLSNLVYLGATYDTTKEVAFENFDGVPSGNNLFNVIFPSDGSSAVQLLLTGSEGTDLSTVNVSTTGIGAGSQHIDVGYSLRIDTVQGMIKANVDDAPEVNQAVNIDYLDTADAGSDARVELVGADFEITQLNPGNANERCDLTISAYNVDGSDQESDYIDNINDNGVPVAITGVKILNGNDVDITATFTGEIIWNVDGTVTIRGLNDGTPGSKTDGDRVFFTTSGAKFDRFLITNADTSTTFDVGNIHVTTVEGGEETEFEELGSSLKFQDDGPLITASGASVDALVVDESTLTVDASGNFAGLFNTPDPGADAPAGLGYTLGVTLAGGNAPNSGLVDTQSGHAIFLFLENLKVIGREGTSAADAANGDVVFEIGVNASSGVVALDQKRAVFHTDSNNHDSTSAAMTAGLITLVATVADAEPDATDDSASASVGIGDKFLFKDDGPTIGGSPNPVTAPNNLGVKNLPNDAAGTDSSSYVLTPGADTLKSFSFLNSPDTSGAFKFAAYDVDGDGTVEANEIKGTYTSGTTTIDLYTLILRDNGTYEFDMIGALPNTRDRLDVGDIKAGAPDTDSITVGTLLSLNHVRITAASTAAGANGNIKESNAFVGVDNGNLDAGESLTFTLEESDNDPLTLEGLSIGTKSAQGGIYKSTAVVAADNSVISGPANGIFVPKNGTLVVDPANVGLLSSITVTKVSGPATKIGLGNIEILTPPNDVVLGFDVRLSDGDNDYVDASFTVSIDGNNDGDFADVVSGAGLAAASSLGLTATAQDGLFDPLRSDGHYDLFLA